MNKRDRLVRARDAAQEAVDEMEAEILRIQDDERALRAKERAVRSELRAPETAENPERQAELERIKYDVKSRIACLMSELQEAHNEIHALRSNRDLRAQDIAELDTATEGEQGNES